MNLSIAIPYHGVRYKWSMKTVHNIHLFSFVEKIIVNAEPGEGDIQKLQQATDSYRKVNVFKNKEQLGPFKNKFVTVGLCPSEWVALIDSDNVLGRSYFPSGITEHELCKDVIYCPAIGLHGLDYRKFIGIDINLKVAVEMLGTPGFEALLNTGNYLFHRKTWIDAVASAAMDSYDPIAVDVLWANFQCLKAGMVIRVVDGMMYSHNVHEGSTYLKTQNDSRIEAGRIKEMMRDEYERRGCSTSLHAVAAPPLPGSSDFTATGGQGAPVVQNQSAANRSGLLTD